MRVIIGLGALAATAASVNAQVVTPNSGNGQVPVSPDIGTVALARINCWATTVGGTPCVANPTGGINNGVTGSGDDTASGFVNTGNWGITVLNAVTTLQFQFTPNKYTAQMQYRWGPSYPNPSLLYPGVVGLSAASYTCDPCAGGTAISCGTSTGPGSGASPTTGFACSRFTRTYTFSNLRASISNQPAVINSLSVQVFDTQTFPAPNVTSYSISITRLPPPIVGDPMIYGIQGQEFQVHGIPDEIFNLITYPTLQVNARFVYLSNADCIDNFTQCFAHPGTYVSEEGIRLGADKIHVKAGSAKKGLSVKINGQRFTQSDGGGIKKLKAGEVHLLNHRRVLVKSSMMDIQISNSDHFLNQETSLLDAKLLVLGAPRTKLLVGDSFYPNVPLHGLQGQTWRNVEYPTGLEYEGSVPDYHVTDGNLFGTSFVFNKYKPSQN